MPFSRIQQNVSKLRVTRSSTEVGIGAVLRDPRHVVEELVLRVGAEIGGGDFLLGEVGHQLFDVVDAVVDDAHGRPR